jgi:hypothetical protein
MLVLALVVSAAVMAPSAGAHQQRQEGNVGLAQAGPFDQLDPIRNNPLACGARPAPGVSGRSQRGGLDHQAYVCEVAGTDMEVQSRRDSNGFVHDYAFAGTIGEGFQIFDVTDPKAPKFAGATNVTGYQNDVVVRGDIAFQAYDGVSQNPVNASPCLAGHVGTDVFKLNYNPETAKFAPQHISCIPNGPGGSHTATIHPSGRWLGISNPGDRSIDIVDLTNVESATFENKPPITYRIIDATNMPQPGQFNSRCPQNATFKCIVARDPSGAPATVVDPTDPTKLTKGCETNLTGSPAPPIGAPPAQTQFCFRPHDLFFSEDGKTMYCACLNATFVMDVSRAMETGLENDPNPFPTLSIIENRFDPPGAPDGPNNIYLSHQADTTPDGKILVVSDERGGGTSEFSCHQPGGLAGVLHFFALAPIPGAPESATASPSNPVKLGFFLNPSPTLPPDALARAERGCTVHVFRIGGNGGGSPGEGANPGLGGVSTLNSRQLVTAWYGAAVWYLDFSSKPDAGEGDDVKEDPRTTWGNTLAWNIQPAADTWSAKEYKGKVLAGDLARGFDVYTLAEQQYRATGFEAGTASDAGGPSGPSCRDRTAPRSTLREGALKHRGTRLSLRGRSRDLTCRLPGQTVRAAGTVRGVSVSIAKIERGACRFLDGKGRLGGRRSCRKPTLLPARGTERWSFAISARLPSGSYRAVVRATDDSGNKERPASRRNVVRFRVR